MPGAPVAFDLVAPAHWHAIDFISDLHLSAALPRTFDAWAAHLRTTPADAVFILGDLFELWVGDEMREREFERACVDATARAARRLTVGFMAGNRDFLVGEALLRDAGMIRLPDPTRLEAWGRPVLLSHGDALCLADRDYQAFRRQVRDPAWQAAFLAKPLAERLAVAAEVRSASAARQRFDGNAATDIDREATARWLAAAGAATLVHGHTHRPGDEAIGAGLERHVLGDWDLDQGERAEVLRLTRDGFERIAPAS